MLMGIEVKHIYICFCPWAASTVQLRNHWEEQSDGQEEEKGGIEFLGGSVP